jgi:hypothetical protein
VEQTLPLAIDRAATSMTVTLAIIRRVLSAILLTSIMSGLGSAAGQAERVPTTLRDLLHANNVNDLRQYPKDLLDAPITDQKRTPRFIHLGFHINPSAERLVVLSRDLKFQKELYGWEVATLPDESIVLHHSQIHFAPTHWLELSVFNPITLKAKQIYPPKPDQPVRRKFIERVDQAYQERGEEWFMRHNHHMDPQLFDSRLLGDVMVDVAAKRMVFTVRYGDTNNGNDPLPFTELVQVTCGPVDQLALIQCLEVAQTKK